MPLPLSGKAPGLVCNAHDLKAAEALVREGKIDELSVLIENGDVVDVKNTTRFRIAKCLDYLAKVAKIDPASDFLSDRIENYFDQEPISKTSELTVELFYPEAVIYCVDDWPSLARCYRSALSMLGGYSNIHTFNNPEVAQNEIFRSTTEDFDVPHVLISDQQMPQMEGTDLFEKLQVLPEELRPSLVLIADDANEKKIQELSAEYGFSTGKKPVDMSYLVKLADDATRRHPVLKRVRGLIQIENDMKRMKGDSSESSSVGIPPRRCI